MAWWPAFLGVPEFFFGASCLSIIAISPSSPRRWGTALDPQLKDSADIKHEREFHAAALDLIVVSIFNSFSLNPLRKSKNKYKAQGSFFAMQRYSATYR